MFYNQCHLMLKMDIIVDARNARIAVRNKTIHAAATLRSKCKYATKRMKSRGGVSYNETSAF